jgi:hypothetical protein
METSFFGRSLGDRVEAVVLLALATHPAEGVEREAERC